MRIEDSIDIDAPAERVWRAVSDPTQWNHWTAIQGLIVETLDAEVRPGQRTRIQQKPFPASTWVLTVLVPGREVTWLAKSLGSRFLAGYVLRPNGSGLTVEAFVEHHSWVSFLTGPMVAANAAPKLRTDLMRLKEYSERPGMS